MATKRRLLINWVDPEPLTRFLQPTGEESVREWRGREGGRDRWREGGRDRWREGGRESVK